jgi:hypothetical protein
VWCVTLRRQLFHLTYRELQFATRSLPHAFLTPVWQELLKSSRLKSYFDDNPVESDLLQKVEVCIATNTSFCISSLSKFQAYCLNVF